MSTTASTMPPAPDVPAWIPPRIHRMTIDEYERMVASGGIASRSRFHLINGYLVDKTTHNPPHAISFQLWGGELGRVTPSGWHVRPALPIRLAAQDSEPEPDHCVARGAIADYAERHPGPADIALVVEIADSSPAEDRDYAANIYGPAGIPACWIVDVSGRRVEVYTGPGPRGYASIETFAEGQPVPVVIGGREVGRIALEALLPPRRPQAKAEGDRP
jgi:Uma2 family endonuclease